VGSNPTVGIMNKTIEKVLRNHKWVGRTPILTTLLLEAANISQVTRMWTERTAEGQSITAWIMVNLALLLWLNFYLTFTPEQKWAIWGTTAGIFLNSLVILSVVYFRYIY
jgi:uncharacterized protein with PQ loop repeat